MIAGVIAILPIGGTILTVSWIENEIADSGLGKQSWYFPGLGILAAVLAVYAVGLVVSTFLGRWIWRIFDRLLRGLPLLGRLYGTLKQILGYGEGEEAIFKEVVAVPSAHAGATELGLVTRRDPDGRLAVFLPGAPNCVDGKLILVRAEAVESVDMTVSDALKSLVSAGAV